jgi:hypothetical protein
MLTDAPAWTTEEMSAEAAPLPADTHPHSPAHFDTSFEVEMRVIQVGDGLTYPGGGIAADLVAVGVE